MSFVALSNHQSFLFQAEDGIRDGHVTGVQTCALPISPSDGGSHPRRNSMKISVQMYSVREALATDFQAAVQRLVNLGFEVAEPFRLVEFRDDLVRARERFDINFPSAHQSFLGDGDFEEEIGRAKAVGVTYLVDPFWEPTDWQDPVQIGRAHV